MENAICPMISQQMDRAQPLPPAEGQRLRREQVPRVRAVIVTRRLT
jgi:hypothetical protein